MPVAVSVLLASVQLFKFILIEMELRESSGAILAKGGALVSEMRAEQIWATVAAAICLALAKLRISRQQRMERN